MRPGKIDWASNDNYAAGPEVGNPTKIPPATGRKADGWEPDEPPPAAWWNFITWSINERLENAAAIRIKNWTQKSTNSIAWAGTLEGCVGVSRPISLTGNKPRTLQHCVLSTVGASAYDSTGIGGEQMTAAAAGGVLPADYMYDIASDLSGNAVVVTPALVANGAYSAPNTAPTTWAAWAATAGFALQCVAYDEINTRWLMYRPSTGIEYSATAGGALTGVAVGGAGALVPALRASNHDAGDLYPDDPGNDVKLLFDNNGALFRSLGNSVATWSNVGPAPFVPAPASERCLAYSKLGSRWGCIVTNGPGSTRPTFAYSDDNGDNWVEVVDSFDFVNRGYPAFSVGSDFLSLACDGFGHWIASAKVSATATAGTEVLEIWASMDNGLTWNQVYFPGVTAGTATSADRADCWYGDGAFWVVHAGIIAAANVLDIFGSLRSGE